MELKKIVRMLIVINILQICLVILIWFFRRMGNEIGLDIFLYYFCMGLYIVKNIVQEVGGTINVTSNKDKTAFEVSIPK